MKLVYHIPDRLYYIQQFFDYPTYKKIHNDIFDSKLKLFSTDVQWGDSLVYGHKSNVLKNDYDSDVYEPFRKMKILLENNPFYKLEKNLRYSFMQHSMGDNAGINWHTDIGYEYGITYYINRRWNIKFGGEFLFKDSNSSGFIPVVGNSLVIVKPPLFHKVCNVMEPTVHRKTIQIFVDKPDNGCKENISC